MCWLGTVVVRYPDGAPSHTRSSSKFRPSIDDQPPGSLQEHWCPRATASVSAPWPDAQPISRFGEPSCRIAILSPALTVCPALTLTVMFSRATPKQVRDRLAREHRPARWPGELLGKNLRAGTVGTGTASLSAPARTARLVWRPGGSDAAGSFDRRCYASAVFGGLVSTGSPRDAASRLISPFLTAGHSTARIE